MAQSAWETSVGRIAQERNVTMKEATGDFAAQTGEAKADFDSSFGACEAEKNRTSALVANDQASVARIKSLMLTLKDRGCNGQDMKKLTPLIPRPPEPTRAERIAILRQGQNGATAPTAPTPTLVVPTPATPAAPAAPFEPVLALLERGLRGGRAVPSETRKLNRLATAFHVKLMPKVDMVEARGGVDVETEDVVGYGHPMVRLPRTSTPACYGCTFVTLHFYTTQHFASHVRRACLSPNAFAHTCSAPSSLRSLASLCSLPQPIRPQTRLLMLPPPLPLRSTRVPRATPSPLTRSELAPNSQALFPDDKRPENVKEEEKEAKAARLAGPRPGDMHGKNPPAWTTGKKAAAAKEEQETTEAEAGKAANTVSLLEEGAHAHAQIEATAAARLGACMSAFAELQLHRTLHRAPDGAEDAGAVQTVKDMEDKLASTRSDAADAFTRCKDRADGLFNKRKGAFERGFRQREVAASGDAEAATDKAQLRLNKALKALAGQEEAGMKLLGDAEAGMETARVVHSGAQGKKEAHDEAFVAGMESANELAGEARSMAETRKRGLVTKAGEAQEKAKTGAQTVLDEAEVALDARCGTMARELTDERRAVALVHVHVSKLKIVGDDPTLLPKQDVPVAPTAGATTRLDDKGEEVVAKTRSCCKMCKSGKACGDSCISKDKTCTKAAGDGCACDAAEKTF